MKVAIYGQTYQDNAIEYLVELLDELHKEPSEVFIEKEFYELYRKLESSKTFPTFTIDEWAKFHFRYVR